MLMVIKITCFTRYLDIENENQKSRIIKLLVLTHSVCWYNILAQNNLQSWEFF